MWGGKEDGTIPVPFNGIVLSPKLNDHPSVVPEMDGLNTTLLPLHPEPSSTQAPTVKGTALISGQLLPVGVQGIVCFNSPGRQLLDRHLAVAITVNEFPSQLQRKSLNIQETFSGSRWQTSSCSPARKPSFSLVV